MSKMWMLPATGLAFAMASGGGCKLQSTIENSVKQDSSCKEFAEGDSFENVKVSATVREYMTAGAAYRALNDNLRKAVRTACANIASDLDGVDSWTALGDSDDALTNAQHTGACDVANARIAAVIDANAQANFALIEVPGACHPDFAAQVACDARCKTEATCDSGTVETRCDPAQLSVSCEVECSAQASCQGTAEKDCNCMGKCESTCTGECKGTCTAADGKQTKDDPNCHGKCSSSCNGKCKGECKLEEAANCGASASCKGGCTGTYTAPSCETEFKPPVCTVDADCEASCTATVSAKAVCDPPYSELLFNVEAAADAAKLKATLDTNLPTLLGARVQGTLVSQSAPKLVVTGASILELLETADVKSVSCATVTHQSAEKVSASLSVSLQASASVVATCETKAL